MRRPRARNLPDTQYRKASLPHAGPAILAHVAVTQPTDKESGCRGMFLGLSSALTSKNTDGVGSGRRTACVHSSALSIFPPPPVRRRLSPDRTVALGMPGHGGRPGDVRRLGRGRKVRSLCPVLISGRAAGLMKCADQRGALLQARRGTSRRAWLGPDQRLARRCGGNAGNTISARVCCGQGRACLASRRRAGRVSARLTTGPVIDSGAGSFGRIRLLAWRHRRGEGRSRGGVADELSERTRSWTEGRRGMVTPSPPGPRG